MTEALIFGALVLLASYFVCDSLEDVQEALEEIADRIDRFEDNGSTDSDERGHGGHHHHGGGVMLVGEKEHTGAKTVQTLSLADMNAYVNAFSIMDAARSRLFGVGLSPVVTVPSGQWLARAASVTGQSLTRNAQGQMVLAYRGLRFVTKHPMKSGGTE